MARLSLRISDGLLSAIDSELVESQKFSSRSEFIIDLIQDKLHTSIPEEKNTEDSYEEEDQVVSTVDPEQIENINRKLDAIVVSMEDVKKSPAPTKDYESYFAALTNKFDMQARKIERAIASAQQAREVDEGDKEKGPKEFLDLCYLSAIVDRLTELERRHRPSGEFAAELMKQFRQELSKYKQEDQTESFKKYLLAIGYVKLLSNIHVVKSDPSFKEVPPDQKKAFVLTGLYEWAADYKRELSKLLAAQKDANSD